MKDSKVRRNGVRMGHHKPVHMWLLAWLKSITKEFVVMEVNTVAFLSYGVLRNAKLHPCTIPMTGH